MTLVLLQMQKKLFYLRCWPTNVLQVNAAGNIALADEEAATFQVEGVIAEIKIEVGDTVAAIERFDNILSDAEAQPGLQRRALQAMVALGGEPTGIGAAATPAEE